jgi:hypothetical protein
MSFLDNLESNLKTLESREERSTDNHQRREAERQQALAAAPWADQLRSSPFTEKLFSEAALTGHRLRQKIYLTWLGEKLRLEARNRRLELRPTPGGIQAVFLENNTEIRQQPVDLSTDPAELLRDWLES